MRCPVGDTDLRVADRLGVEIDVCPRCRGVWLDRGELEKLLDRADRAGLEGGDRGDDRRGGETPGRHPPRKKGFWSELFDFD